MCDDDGPPVNKQCESLARRFEKEGLDVRLLEEPFLEASELGDAQALKQCLQGLSDDDRRKFIKSVDQHGRSGLLLAARHGNADVARVLLDAGANPNEIDNFGATALHYASGRTSVAAVMHLLHCRAEADRRDDQGETPLMWAADSRVASVLLQASADPTALSRAGKTAMMLASTRGDLQIVQTLATRPGIDIDAKDASGSTARSLALSAGHLEIAAILESLGASDEVALEDSVESQQRRKLALRPDEALFEAARQGDAQRCKGLLEDGDLDVNLEKGGETALLLAAAEGAGRVIEVLLDARADINCTDAYMQETPLMRAVLAQCSLELLWLMLEARADPSLADLTGRTPVSVAQSWGNGDACAILEAAAEGTLHSVDPSE